MGYQFRFDLTPDDWAMLFEGTARTAVFTLISVALGLAISLVGASWRIGHNRWLRWISTIYVEAIRNTPLLVLLLLVFFGLPSLGVRMSADQAAIIALTISFGAYATEIVRSGIESIPQGQIEAAQALGLTRFEIYRNIVIIPALEKVYPALISQCTLLMLGSAIVSAIGANDLTGAANSVQAKNFRSFEVYFITSALYFAITMGMRFGFGLLAQAAFPRRRALGPAFRKGK